MDTIKQRFVASFDELSVLTAAAISDSTTYNQVLDTIETLLINAYISAAEATEDTIDEIFEMDTVRMFEVIEQKTAGEDYRQRIIEHLEQNDYEGIKRVAETEFHRVFNQGVLDVAQASPKTLYKTWVTMEDDKVRDTHFYLEGMKVPLDEKFVTYDGDSALYPGGFELAENNVNCRCVIDIQA